tara:strand:- start:338 stop:598 length:261 start_codon:yes stop_codon:yes gene_type:complete
MYEDDDNSINPVDEDHEEFHTLGTDDEFEIVMDHLIVMVSEFQLMHGREPTKIYVSDDNEVQSVMMYSADTLGLEYDRTEKKTYLE